MKDLLLEIGCENLPPHAIEPAFEQLRNDAAKKLEDSRLTFESIYSTGAPRRLVLIVRGLSGVQKARTEVVTGPPVSKAYDEKGLPTPTARGFARSHGIEVEKLEKVKTPRGEYVGFTKQLTCARTPALLKEILPGIVTGLKFPKMMKWETSGTRFARPIRWIVCLYGDTLLPFDLAGVMSGRHTHVQPWLFPARYAVKNASDYLSTLAKAGVTLDHEERRRAIAALAREEADKKGLELIDDPSLVDELAFMLESPHVLAGEFDESYLRLPPEVVITAMKAHQRYLAVRSGGGKLHPMFLTFTEGKTGAPSTVRQGNERVLKARLEDALFYWKEDLATGIEGLARRLESIVFIEGLGTLKHKSERLYELGVLVNGMWPPGERLSADLIRRGSMLAKADLASEMVKDGKEFTLLEGLIGSHYALEARERSEVVLAIREHYLPRSPSDPLPGTPLGTVLGIADRVDVVAGCFIAGLIPTGSQDPYALRRQAMGLVRILEHNPQVSIRPLIRAAVDTYASTGLGGARDGDEVVSQVEDFFRARTETFLKDRGIAPDAVSAVAAVAWSTPGVALRRAKAIEGLRGDRSFELLITGVKRVGNILSGDRRSFGAEIGALQAVWAGTGGKGGGNGFDPGLFEDDTERALYNEIRSAMPRIAEFDARSDYTAVFKALSSLGPAIDRYFESVLVNCPDAALRANRHRFLAAVFALFSKYADFSHIVEEGKAPVS